MNRRKRSWILGTGVWISLFFLTARLPAQPFAEDRVLVAFRPGVIAGEVSAAHDQVSGKVVDSWGTTYWHKLT